MHYYRNIINTIFYDRQLESYDENNFQTPPGFNCIFLPFAEDIRDHSSIIPKNTIQPN